MSRIGSDPLDLPKGVTAVKQAGAVTVKGPKGEVVLHWPAGVELEQSGATLTVQRRDDSKPSRAAHGTARRVLENAVRGVVEPYKRVLEIVGVGFQARLAGPKLGLKVGFANEVLLDVPKGVKVDLPSVTRIEVSGCDKQSVGAFASVIRNVRPPEPYNGKGIRFDGERIQRKAGKSFASAG